MNQHSALASIQGNRLSCYTASIAAYMEAHGIDHRLALGAQLFLAVNMQTSDGLQCSFVHYHTPLLGDTATHSLSLMRRSTTDADVAAQAIRAEQARSGAVIVVGDAINLPWLVTYGRKHAPHWFLLSGVNAQQLEIVDRFEFVDEAGTQAAFMGTVPLERLPELAQVNPAQQPVFAARDRWAFGVEEYSGPPTWSGYQWFEALQPPTARSVSDAAARALLLQTWRFNTGQQRRADLDPARWSCGLEAIKTLSGCFEEYLTQLDIDEISDDLWVAARNRQMFATTLGWLGARLELDALSSLATWCDEQLVPQWHAIPRVLRYNVGCLRRGRAPSRLLIETLNTIVDLEAECMERLGAIVADPH